VKTVLVVVMIAAAAGCAWAAEPETIEQVGVGAYLITESTADFDPDVGWAINYFRLSPRNWYASAEMGRYNATVYYEQVGVAGRQSAKVDVTVWAAIIGRAVRSRDGRAYAGAGIGWLADRDVDLGYGVRFESSMPLGWEVIAGTLNRPVGVQVRYRDGGMPANTGITASVNYAW
jgi:hypothetical protein